jgi:hypothetical protein
MGSIWVPFAPSVFNGTGGEPRKSIVFSVSDDVRRGLEAIEEWCREALRDSTPQIDGIWRSAIKPASRYPASLKAKVTLAGPGACSFYDGESQRVPEPEDWSSLACVPIVQVRGCYVQKGGAGLMLEVTALMVGGRREHAREEVAFL